MKTTHTRRALFATTPTLSALLIMLVPAISACGDGGGGPGGDAVADGGDDPRADAATGDDAGDDPDGGPSAGASCVRPVAEVVLAETDAGLTLVSAPPSVALDLGAPAHLAVRVEGHRRPLEIAARLPIHTWLAGATAAGPGDESLVPVATIDEARTALELRTVRMYDHALVLSVRPDGDEPAIEVTIGVDVTVPPRTALFGTDATWLGAPFADVYGPDCTPCGTPTTEDRDCARSVADDSRCHPWGARFDPTREARSMADAVSKQEYASQIVRDGPTDQGHVFLDEDLLSWMVGEGDYPWYADWVYGALKPAVGGHWSGGPWILPGASWMNHCGERCENANGAPAGLWDETNDFLMGQFRWYVGQLAERYAGKVPFYELVNEPSAEFWLCGCSSDFEWDPAVCLENEEPAGPNLPVCWWAWDDEQGQWAAGPYAPDFALAYGDLLLATATAATEQIEQADPSAIVIAIETDTPTPGVQGLSTAARHFMEQGFFAEHPSAVLGVHSYPQVDVRLWLGTIDCAYAGAFNYDLPEGCETAPPLEGTFQPRPDDDPRSVREAWIAQDRAADLSELLADVRDLETAGAPVSLEDLRMFDTEIHSGWHETYLGRPSTLTSRARETMAALRLGAIMAHQGFVGIEFVNGPEEPDDFNQLVVHLSGARPVWRWDAQRIIEDEAAYDGVVYKLFTRGDEDVIAVWSNASAPVDLALEPAPGDTCFSGATVTTITATDGGGLDVDTTRGAAPPAELRVEPLRQFHFVSVVSDRPGFGWLEGIEVGQGDAGSD